MELLLTNDSVSNEPVGDKSGSYTQMVFLTTWSILISWLSQKTQTVEKHEPQSRPYLSAITGKQVFAGWSRCIRRVRRKTGVAYDRCSCLPGAPRLFCSWLQSSSIISRHQVGKAASYWANFRKLWGLHKWHTHNNVVGAFGVGGGCFGSLSCPQLSILLAKRIFLTGVSAEETSIR